MIWPYGMVPHSWIISTMRMVDKIKGLMSY